MQIYGFNKTTLLDYPEHVAATIFTGGCNFRCPFCHNGGLVMDTAGQQCVSAEEVLTHLRKRKGILDGVCITGGEPTLQPDLQEFIGQIKELGYLIKLDTNGYRPEVLRNLLEAGMLDYVAMDIKGARENYGRAAGLEHPDISRIEESVALLQNSGIPYEFRTTVVKGIHTQEELESIGRWLAGSRAYYLQAFRENENLLAYYMTSGIGSVAAGYRAFSKDEMEEMADIVRNYIPKTVLRGLE